MENKITERTLIPISLMITIASVIIWATMIYSRVDAQERLSQKNEQRIDSMTMILVDIRDRIIRLEEHK